jgi:UDP-glucose 4-epimerase
MKLLVTGGAGYIGSHTAALLAKQGHEIWIFDNLSRGHRQAARGHHFVEGDLQDYELLKQVLAAGINGVMHFAALTYVGESVEEPAKYYRNNFGGTLKLLEAMRANDVQKIVFSSTAAVYGTPQEVPIRESAAQEPINPYGRSKLAVEWLLADYASAYGIGYAALRYFNAAGASTSGELGEDHSPETHLIPIVLQAALGQRLSVDVFGTDYSTADGTCVRDYVHVEDLADAHSLALQAIEPGRGSIFNLGSGQGYSVQQVITACEEVTGKKIPVRYGNRRPGDPPVLVASSEKIQQKLSWRPHQSTLKNIIQSAWRWHALHPHGYGRPQRTQGMEVA